MHAHHEDHSKPLDIQWLCSLCHSKVDPNYGGRARKAARSAHRDKVSA